MFKIRMQASASDNKVKIIYQLNFINQHIQNLIEIKKILMY